jgi:hypothetical protein
MTPAQEDFALRSCYPLYAEWCREDEDDSEGDIECDECRCTWTEQDLIDTDWHCPNCKHLIGD